MSWAGASNDNTGRRGWGARWEMTPHATGPRVFIVLKYQLRVLHYTQFRRYSIGISASKTYEIICRRLLFFLGQRTKSFPPFSFRRRPQNTARGSGSDVSNPIGVRGKAPADKRFLSSNNAHNSTMSIIVHDLHGSIWSQKVQLWWQQFLLLFS